jgi:hypothetical protein
MRLALIAAPKQIRGQTAATIAQPNDPVKFAELAGSVIEARVVRDQIIRQEGRTFPTRLQNDIELVIGPDDGIQQTITPTSDTPRDRRFGRTRTVVFTLEKPTSLRGLGGGDGVYIFEDAVLTFLRTFKEGAFKRAIAFSRSSGGPILCRQRSLCARRRRWRSLSRLFLAATNSFPRHACDKAE